MSAPCWACSYYIPAGETAFIGYGGSGAESFFVGAGQFLSAKALGGNNGGQIGVF